MAVDAAGNLYIAETQGNHVRRVSAGGIISTIAGRALYGYLWDTSTDNPDPFLHGYSGDGGPSASGSETGEPVSALAVDSELQRLPGRPAERRGAGCWRRARLATRRAGWPGRWRRANW